MLFYWRVAICMPKTYVYKRANKYLKGRSVQNLDFDCSGLRNGQYILCIYANEKVFCNTINI